MAENEVVKHEEKLPAVFDYGEDAGRGFENQTNDEKQVPFLALLQDLSPQVTGSDGKEYPGAKAGKLFNTVTEEVLGGDAFFVPAHREHIYTEWRPRTQGGGFVGRYAKDDPVVVEAVRTAKEFGKYKTPAGNELVETFYLYGVLCREDGDLQPAVVAFTSTKIAVFKKWNTQVSLCTVPQPDGRRPRPPYFAHLVKISSVRQTSPKGTFFNLVLSPAKDSIRASLLQTDDPRFLAARALADMVASGAAKAAENTQAAEENTPF